ncbi:hypothetical protein QUB80_01250 [Chlorogloeopsis sp. ULAP01]|uniref:hypothetical protein n=1 Tax=Chlorogloeopsis sp. ULAP01 TaxID=3056483 RepID=UPI0025AA95DC|nr:hypothetical protein [Chlorogloeopsis sp. ULAP01]MDM9379335.1 hypothetical protein [Chlorogloeopsis sp. ULAP01]
MNTGGLLAFVCMVAIAVYLQCFTESEFLLNPLIDTQLPSGFTQTKFESIKPGMTQAEVLKILPPPEYLSNDDSWAYGNDGAAPFGDFAWFRFVIYFDRAGIVTKTERQKFHD